MMQLCFIDGTMQWGRESREENGMWIWAAAATGERTMTNREMIRMDPDCGLCDDALMWKNFLQK